MGFRRDCDRRYDPRPPQGRSRAMIPVSARNIEFVGHSDQQGRGDGVQVMVHKGHAFVGHMFSDGFTVTDVRDPRQPRPVNFVAAPPNSRAFHLQTHGDLLLTVNSPNIWVLQGYADPNDYFKPPTPETFTRRDKAFTAGLRVFDISKPAEPREIAFMPVDGLGLHRLWYVGGRYAYASCHWQGFTDHVLAIIDMQEPTRPEVVGRWWLPGMHAAGGETPTWSGKRYALHHAIVAGNLALFADEGNLDNCANGIQRCWVFDVREPSNPVQIAAFPTPAEEDYCRKGAKFGPHNLHENRPGSFQSSDLIFATYQNAGVRVFDIADPFCPREVAHFVPPAPERMVDPRPNRPRIIQSNDVYVAPDGLMYVTDVNDGLTILQYKG